MGGGREVCESCLEGVITEMVSAYSAKPDLAARRIEAIGYQVGHQLCERYTMERPRFTEHLEAIKFICKDFWSELFKKQIDNLKTNHRGTFVLQDNRFRWLMRIPVDASLDNMDSPSHRYQSSGDKSMTQALSLHLYFPCGIIRGALSNLGIPCAVSADISNLPACELNTGSGNRVRLSYALKHKILPCNRDLEEIPPVWLEELRFSLFHLSYI